MDWSELYPHFFPGNPSEEKPQQVEFADIGCGYGGLLGDLTTSFWLVVVLLFIIWSLYSCLPLCFCCPVELSPLFPDKLMLGLEIRVKVSDYVRDRIQSLRASEPEKYQNIACIRSNAMKYLPNFFCKGQVQQCSVGSTGAIHSSWLFFPYLVKCPLLKWITMTVFAVAGVIYCDITDNRSQFCHNSKHLFHARCWQCFR